MTTPHPSIDLVRALASARKAFRKHRRDLRNLRRKVERKEGNLSQRQAKLDQLVSDLWVLSEIYVASAREAREVVLMKEAGWDGKMVAEGAKKEKLLTIAARARVPV